MKFCPFCLHFLATLFAIVGLTADSSGATPSPFTLEFLQTGGYAQYNKASIRISPSGETIVTIQAHGGQDYEHRTTLSAEELELFRVTVRSVDFFDSPPQDTTPPRLHAPGIELRINDGEKTRELKGTWPDSWEPLAVLTYRLMVQARAIHDIESDGDIYTAIGAVKHSHAGAKVLQPTRLREPLMTYIRNHQDRQRVNWALQALAELTSPEEFAGFVALESRDRKVEHSLLEMDSKGWIPDTHFAALCPLYHACVRDLFPRYKTLSAAEKRLIEVAAMGLREARYEPAVPFLVEAFRKSTVPSDTCLFMTLSGQGLAALRHAAPLLSEGDDAHRLGAVDLVMYLSFLNPDAGTGSKLPKHEYDQMRPIFTTQVLPRLQEMAEKESSKTVRESAAKARLRIEEELKKGAAKP